MFKKAFFNAVWEQSRAWLYVIFVIVLLSISLLVYQSQVIAPETEQLLRRQNSLQAQLQNRKDELAESGVPVSAVEQMEKDLDKFSALIPEKQKFADFVGELFHLADQADLNIRQISYQPKIDKETTYLYYDLSFSVLGPYGQLKKFIHLLENSKRILIIEQIGLAGRSSKDNSASVALQINLTTLFQEGMK